MAILALTAVGALSLGSGEARASTVSCGATVTTDTKLDKDVLNCPNEGVVIGADNITLDLNGHTVSGDGAPVASCPDGAVCDVGIDNSAGHRGVRITHGTVRDFDGATFVLGAAQDRIERLISVDNSRFGMIVAYSTDTRLDHSASTNDGINGIVVFDSQRLRVDHDSVTGTSGYAVPVFGSSHNRFDHNVLTSDKHGFLLTPSDNPGSNDNAVTDNRMSTGPGIDIDQSSDNVVGDNTMNNPGDGILIGDSPRTQVRHNTVKDAGIGFPADGPAGFGILLDGTDDSVVVDNTLSGGRAPAIFLTSLDEPDTSDRNLVSGNRVVGNLGDGIVVKNSATDNRLEGNAANRNGQDGIHIDATATTVKRNTANENSAYGIEAVPGVIDGGGNTANGNGNPLQCVNVFCK